MPIGRISNFVRANRVFVSISLLLLLAPAFINFDAHHDGLILTTTLELKRAISHGNPWPFNQYGQFWAFPFALIALVVPNSYLFLSIRLLTFLYYILTTYLLTKISSRFLPENYARVPVVIFLIAQPFALGLNSSFLPWPSALCMLLVTFILERLTNNHSTLVKQNGSGFLVGILVFLLTGTRLQVGLISFLGIGALLILHREIRVFLFFLGGFSVSLIAFELFMFQRNWLYESFYDSVVFSSQYVSGDTSTYPWPRVTMILSLSILVALYVLKSTLKRTLIPAFFSKKFLIISLIIPLVAIIILGNLSSIDFFSWVTLLTRRSWISLSIAILLLAVISHFSNSKKLKNVFNKNNYNYNMLILISVCSFTQLFPLFDQMHFWWGFSPLIVLMVVLIKNQTSGHAGLNSLLKPLYIFFSTVLILINSIGVVLQLHSIEGKLNSTIARGIFVSDTTDNDIASFLNREIPPSSSILSLCPNSNALFSLKKSFSSIRGFVLWSPTFEFDEYRDSFFNADFDFVVSCPMLETSDSLQIKINSAIAETLNYYKLTKISSFKDRHGRTWSIYK
jgi:hypothetical protein